MLDTNIVGALIGARAERFDARLAALPTGSVVLSVLTEAEILFGLAKTPEATRLARLMRETLGRFQILPWTSATALVYAPLRAEMWRTGKSLQPLDMLIAAHALEAGATLVTSDRAFRNVPGLAVEDWTAK
jgi:tRNA(fMet)-specific endonuclease VapC